MRFQVTSPDGQKFVVNAPEGATQEQALAFAQQHFAQRAEQRTAIQQDMQRLADPTAGMSTLDKLNAGIGKAFSDVGKGAAQLVGMGPSGEEVAEQRKLDAPMMKTGAGVTGNVLGNLALLAPASVLPGAASIPGAAALGATVAALQPTQNTGERLTNMAIGGGLGGAAQYLGTTGARLLGERAATKAAEAQTAQVQNAVRDQALKAGRQAGYVVPPSTINPTLKNSVVESVGGKSATQQQASVTNQKVTDTLARQALGLKPNAPLTEQILGNMRQQEGQAYAAIKNVGGKFNADQQFTQEVGAIGQEMRQVAQEFPNSTKNSAIENLLADLNLGSYSPNAILQKVRMLRADASANFKAFNDPEKLALARAQRQAAEALDGLVERNLAAAGKADLSTAYQQARVNIAKLHDVEAALTPGGHIDARVLAKIAENGRVTGELKTIADFAGNFPKAVQTGEKVGSPMVHALRPSIGSAVGGVIGGVPGAAIGGAAGVAVPFAARSAMLSPVGQAMMASPSYGPGLLGFAAQRGLLPSPDTAGLLSRTAIPAIYSGLAQ